MTSCAAPTEPAGVVIVTEVESFAVIVAAAPPIVTPVRLPMFVPDTTTPVCPPVSGPEEGEILDGAGTPPAATAAAMPDPHGSLVANFFRPHDLVLLAAHDLEFPPSGRVLVGLGHLCFQCLYVLLRNVHLARHFG